MVNKRLAVLAACVFSAAASVFAAPHISITAQAGSGRDLISLNDVRASGDTANLFLSVLKSDLENSGFFTVGNSGYERLKVEGSASGNGGNLSTHLRFTWGGGAFSWNEVSSSVQAARWQAHRFSDEIVHHVKPNVTGMSATRIALIGKHDGSDVYYCDYDGKGLCRLTSDRVPALSPYFHPNGQYIFYTSFVRKQPNVYRVPVAGGSRTPYASFTGLNTGGAVSPDGAYLAVILSNPGNPELYVINMSSRKATRLTKTPRAAEASPCWSPDGRKIAYVSDETGRPSLFVIDSGSGVSRRITFHGAECVAPSWGASNKIAFSTKQGASYQIAICNPDGSGLKVLTSGPDHEDPSWAPDGRHIICSRKDGYKRSSICIIDTESDDKITLALPAGDWHAPDWSHPISH